MIRIAVLGVVFLAAAIFENLGDAAGYIVKGSGWGQYALAIGAMSIYGALIVTVGRSGWSFMQAFPLGYLFVYFGVGLVFGAVLAGHRPRGFQVVAAALMMLGLLVNLAGNLKSPSSINHPDLAHRPTSAAPGSTE